MARASATSEHDGKAEYKVLKTTKTDHANGEAGEEEDEDEDEEEEEEPRLKYVPLTKSQGAVYRGGDSVSAFLVAGDKMIVGTHEGVVHVISLPSFQPLRVYQAHKRASVTAISISPFPPPLPAIRSVESSSRPIKESEDATKASSLRDTSPEGRTPRKSTVPATPSNSIHVATSSIDGNVCVSSLVDPRDILMRSFGRPVQTVALSPQYKNDRTYISGGKAGNLILTVGGKAGTSAVSTTIGGAMATTNGWLENMGISGSNGVDTVLHRGEGEISTIKWSLNGRYVAWVNEKGIKIMRSNLHLDPGDAELSWKRLTHIDPPDIVGWEDMARLWRARVEWIDEAWLEPDTDFPASANGHRHANSSTPQSATDVKTRERLIVGWGGNIWVIDVHSSARELGKELEERRVGRVELVAFLRTDCIISGISLFSSNLLLVLAYVLPGDSTDAASTSTHGTPKKGVHRRQNALQPEVRIIDIFTQEEEYTDTLNMSRYEGLSTTDYHLGVLPPTTSKSPTAAQRGTLEVISGSIWDATMYPKRLFSSATSVQSGTSTTNAGHSGNHAGSTATSGVTDLPSKKPHGPHPALLTSGMKVFIQSPYDCVLATKPTTADHLSWLDVHERYEEAWNLLDTHPEALGNLSENVTSSVASTPTKIKQDSMEEFFASIASQSSTLISKNLNSQVEKEKRRIGEKWMQKLTEAKDWTRAGQISNSVLVTSRSWEHWIWVFAEANQFEAITPFVPTKQLHPPISPTVYEMILGHYIAKDRVRLRDLLESWPPALFSVGSIIAAVEDNLRSEASEEDTDKDDQPRQDWRILKNCLAKLYLANGQVKDALRCFIDLHDADEAMHLISEYHLVDALADDIPGLILLRVSQEQYRNASLNELESASREAIDLLAAEALTGIVRADAVISQLQSKEGMQSFLYFYFRALWKGRASISPTVPKFSSTTDQLASEGRALVNDHADVAINLFAEYDRELFFDFLKSSQSYDLSSASDVCEMRKYIPELVYLLAKEGRTKRALYVIIEMQGDVSAAIFFAKEQDDPDLWNDLLDYSMNKPSFIRALLEEVGTAIDPIMLVRRIPEGLEVQGLRKALSRMLKEYELQHSISEGVARVFRGEVSLGMLQLRNGQKRGIKFDVKAGREGFESSQKVRERISGHCSQCGMAFVEDEKQTILGYPCGHTFHLACCVDRQSEDAPDEDLDETHHSFQSKIDVGVGAKIRHAKKLRDRVGTGCPLENRDTN